MFMYLKNCLYVIKKKQLQYYLHYFSILMPLCLHYMNTCIVYIIHYTFSLYCYVDISCCSSSPFSIITGSCVDTSADHSSSCVSVSINGFLSAYIIASGAKINRLKFLLDKGKRNVT